MPAHINYETTPIIFYKFVCENPEIKSCYVGQTINFQQRKNSHKSRCHKKTSEHYNYKIYETIRENGGWDKWNMVEINRQICLDKSDAGKIEQHYIEELQANMNMLNAGAFNRDEWYLNNKDRICQKNKIRHELNKVEHNAKNKIRYEQNKERYLAKQKEQFICECGLIFQIGNRFRHFKSKIHLEHLAIINNVDNIQNEFSNSEKQST